jgi:hypothetical protein
MAGGVVPLKDPHRNAGVELMLKHPPNKKGIHYAYLTIL